IIMTIIQQNVVFGGYKDNDELPLNLMYLILALVGSYITIIALIIIYYINQEDIDRSFKNYFDDKKKANV
ncbi:MAG: hypothetical protein U9Q66_00205, partial [Patescibacteria group bacterium]|nr:hypothetical protein [Patescibacteria group bacterium]